MIISPSKKKLISLFLLTVLIYLSFGYILIFNPLIAITKEIIWKKLEKDHYKDKIELIVFSKKDIGERAIDFIRVNHKEFRLYGSMYDIVKEWEDGDSIYFQCYLDVKETFLQKLFHKHLNKSKTDNQTASLISFLNFLTATQPDENSSIDKALRKLDTISGLDQSIKHKNIPKVPTPPPRIG